MTLWLLEFAGERAIRLGEPDEWCPACLDMLELLWGEDIEVVAEDERGPAHPWGGIYLARRWQRVMDCENRVAHLPDLHFSATEQLFGETGARRSVRERRSSVARAYLDIQAVVFPGQGEGAQSVVAVVPEETDHGPL